MRSNIENADVSWQIVSLDEIVEIDRNGVDPSQLQENEPYVGLEHIDSEGRISWGPTVGGTGVRSTKFRFTSRHILFGKLRPYLRKVARPKQSGVCSTDILPLLPKDGMDRDFLFHLLRTDDTINRATAACSGANLPRLSPTKFRTFEFRVPRSISEQKRIAAILDKADAIRRKRRQAIRMNDEFLRSVFIDMFGDPATNPKGWKTGIFGDVVSRLEGGKNIAETNEETSRRVLKVSSVTYGEYRPEESKFIPNDFPVPESYWVRPGDLLISRANTKELIGATAFVWETPPNMMLPDKIWRFVWRDPNNIDPLFIHELTRTPFIKREIARRASGTSGSMKNIAKPKLLGVPIPIPPSNLQKRFGDFARRIHKVTERLSFVQSTPDDLFQSLQQRAFQGKL